MPDTLPAPETSALAPSGFGTLETVFGPSESQREALESARWNRGRAAERLGMSRSTLWRRMKELGIE